jgi:hypothetical protein
MRWVFVGVRFALSCFVGVAVWYGYPRRALVNDDGIVYYHGLGLSREPAFWGRVYDEVVFPLTVAEDGFCAVECNAPARTSVSGERLYSFLAHYPNGRIRARGLCRWPLNSEGEPKGIIEVVSGTFWDPAGSTSSQIQNGTGIETYWTHDGKKVWESTVDRYRRTRLKCWHRNGQLQAEYACRDGKFNGLVQFYAEDGSPDGKVLYEDGLVKERK